MRHLHSTALLPIAGAALAAPTLASDLALDGAADLVAPIGTAVELTLDGLALAPASVALDISPGPVTLFGESLPLGLTPAFQIPFEGQTDAAGRFSVPLTLPNDPALIGVTLYFLGAVIDPSSPSGLDFSNGASLTFGDPEIAVTEVDLFGVVRPGAPFFDWVTTTQESEPIMIAVDPNEQPQATGLTVDAYLVNDRSKLEWNANPTLTDVSGNGADSIQITATDVATNTFEIDTGTIFTGALASPGLGYDIVLDLDGDGQLSAGDLVDGYADGAGMYVMRDPTVPGPYQVVEVLYSGGTFLGQNLFYPANIAELDQVHLVVVSHGNGHNYNWYDHIGEHLASYGYVVMSHQNNTNPGIQTASTTTLTNTEYFLANLDTIEGGILDGKIIRDEIAWIGHSRGGEGVVRAYDRLFDDNFVSPEFDESDIVLVSSIAPTVFENPKASTPHGVDYHIWVGAGDSDVSGCTGSNITQSFQLFGRAENQRQAISLYGVGHGWFHNGNGSFINGPCQIGRTRTHEIMRGYLLPLVEWHLRENPAARDWLWRQYEDLRPTRVESESQNACIVANLQFSEGVESGKLVIESMQGDTTDLVASSGVPITANLTLWDTARADDGNSAFTDDPTDIFNGATYARATGPEFCGTIGYEGGTDQSLVFDLDEATDDWSSFGWLSFRAAVITRHPTTIASLGDHHFEVRLVDADGDAATLSTASFLAGLEEPYQRTGCGQGVGWLDEFETVRFGLRAFRAVNPALDVDKLDQLEFLFGPSHGDPEGRLLIDDIEVTID